MKHMFSRLLLFCFAAVVFTGCDSQREIVSDVPEKQANEIVVFLASKGVPAEKKMQATSGAGAADATKLWTITVQDSRATEALAILNRYGLPRRPGPSLLSLFAKSGLVSSAQEEQIRFQEGLGEQIAGVIRKIDGVIDANVQISTPPQQETLATEPQTDQKVRASVYVKHSGILDDPNSQLITKIKRLVAASVVGLDYDDVTVVSDRARYTDITFEGTPDAYPGEDREWVQVWSVVLSKESVNQFRTIFFTLLILLIVFAAFIVWLLWKLYPLIAHGGGLSSLFTSVKPLHLEEKKPEGEEEETEDEEV